MTVHVAGGGGGDQSVRVVIIGDEREGGVQCGVGERDDRERVGRIHAGLDDVVEHVRSLRLPAQTGQIAGGDRLAGHLGLQKFDTVVAADRPSDCAAGQEREADSRERVLELASSRLRRAVHEDSVRIVLVE